MFDAQPELPRCRGAIDDWWFVIGDWNRLLADERVEQAFRPALQAESTRALAPEANALPPSRLLPPATSRTRPPLHPAPLAHAPARQECCSPDAPPHLPAPA